MTTPKKPSELDKLAYHTAIQVTCKIDNFIPHKFSSAALETITGLATPVISEALISLLLYAKERLPSQELHLTACLDELDEMIEEVKQS